MALSDCRALYDHCVVGSVVVSSHLGLLNCVSRIIVSCRVVASTSRRRIVVVVCLHCRFVVIVSNRRRHLQNKAKKAENMSLLYIMEEKSFFSMMAVL
jgi:hypothetical protein